MSRANDIKINGERHTPIVLKVRERDDFGRPTLCEVGYEDSSFSVEDGAEFLVVWAKRKTVAPRTKGNA